jgi:hypothetical protein
MAKGIPSVTHGNSFSRDLRDRRIILKTCTMSGKTIRVYVGLLNVLDYALQFCCYLARLLVDHAGLK